MTLAAQIFVRPLSSLWWITIEFGKFVGSTFFCQKLTSACTWYLFSAGTDIANPKGHFPCLIFWHPALCGFKNLWQYLGNNQFFFFKIRHQGIKSEKQVVGMTYHHFRYIPASSLCNKVTVGLDFGFSYNRVWKIKVWPSPLVRYNIYHVS